MLSSSQLAASKTVMRSLIKCVFLSLSLSIAAAAQAGQPTVERGRVIDGIQISTDRTQTYAVYLPSTFDPKKSYPLILAFDPGGRGAAGVAAYQKAAEKYGYIVVGSNSSRNGIDNTTLTTVLNATLAGDKCSFRDRSESRAGGRIFRRCSGRNQAARGVMQVCLWRRRERSPDFRRGVTAKKDLPFLYVGTIGVDDFNYPDFAASTRSSRLRESRTVFSLSTADISGHLRRSSIRRSSGSSCR